VVTSQSAGSAPHPALQVLSTLQTPSAGYWPAGQLVQPPSPSQPAHAAGQLQDPSAWQTLPVAAEQAGHGGQPPAPSL
jgi:hypothetical protein